MSINEEVTEQTSEVVCVVAGKPAELFIRNEQNRLVPLSRVVYERLKLASASLKGKLAAPAFQWLSGSMEEISLASALEEFKSQPLSEMELKRQEKYKFYKDLSIVKILWSNHGPIQDEALVEFLPEGKTLGDFKISRLVGYPTKDMNTVILADKELSEENMKTLWDSYLKKN